MSSRSAHVLLAWELGQSYGHIARCLKLARTLALRNARSTLALKSINLPTALRWDDPLQIVQAPVAKQILENVRPRNHAELLLHCGFGKPDELASRLKAWLSMLSALKPDVVVTDHAPTALLASRLTGTPAVVMGNGFTVPPVQQPWPAFLPWDRTPPSTLRAAEACLDQRIAQALTVLGWSTPGIRMRELYEDAPALMDIFAELDQYPHRTGTKTPIYVGPITGLHEAAHAAWTESTEAKVLAYLHPHTPGLAELLEALAATRAEVHCVIPRQLGESPAAPPSRPGLHVHAQPLHLPALLPQTTLAITNGNSGVSTQCLLAGIPVLTYPRHTEQGLFGMAIERMGAGVIAGRGLTSKETVQLLHHLLNNRTCREQAKRFAARHASHHEDLASDQAAKLILQVIE